MPQGAKLCLLAPEVAHHQPFPDPSGYPHHELGKGDLALPEPMPGHVQDLGSAGGVWGRRGAGSGGELSLIWPERFWGRSKTHLILLDHLVTVLDSRPVRTSHVGHGSFVVVDSGPAPDQTCAGSWHQTCCARYHRRQGCHVPVKTRDRTSKWPPQAPSHSSECDLPNLQRDSVEARDRQK